MRIVYIAGSWIPSFTANSIQVMKMCQAFAQEGHSIELLTPLWQKDVPRVDDVLWRHYGIRTPFPITWIPKGGFLKCHTFHIRSSWYARSLRPDLIYTRGIDIAAVSSLLGIPNIYEAHHPPGGILGMPYFYLTLHGRGFRKLVVISQALNKLLHKRYPILLRGKQTVVAYSGVDLEQFNNFLTVFEARRKLRLDENRFTVGYTGNFYAGRGIDLIIRLAQDCKGIFFLIIGGNPMSAVEQKSRAQHMGLKNIQFINFVNNEELPLYQSACDVLLMPYQYYVAGSSGSEISGFFSPMKLFEYMATGRLIISSDLPALKEILNEKNAVLCNPEDMDAWKAALNRAISDPKWRYTLGQQAYHDVKDYSWQNRIRHILNNM